jgi:serine/threonine-protein kinase
VFAGNELTEVLARILEREPDWTVLPVNTPTAIRTLLKRCLEKDRRKRIADISTARFVLEDHANFAPARDLVTATGRTLAQPMGRRLTLVAALALLLVAAAAGTGVWLATRPASMPVTRVAILTSAATALNVEGNDRDLVITPDGTRLVYRGTNQLLVRALDRLDATVLGSFGAPRGLFVSPDSQWVGFVDGAGTSPLKKVAITGGPAVTLTMTDGASRGAAWGEDGNIVYATSSGATGLQRISSAGGAPTVLTKPDRARGEADHLHPEFLPGGQTVLFTIIASTGGLDNAQVAVLDLRTGTYTTVLRGGHHAHYVPTGHLVFGANGTLRAVPFDLGRREVTGPPVPILDGVVTSADGSVDVTVATTGTLVYVPGRGVVGAQRSLVWVDRMGRETPLPMPVRAYQYPRFSPDGTRMALAIRDQEQDIWVWDLVRQTLTRLTFDPGVDVYPVWTPDSRRIVFGSQRAGPSNIYSQAADGTGAVERLTDSARTQYPYSMTSDGGVLVLREDAPQTGSDLLRRSLATSPSASSRAWSSDAGALQPLVQTMFAELNAELAPDGRWIAYQSNESGRDEIYVRPFPDVTRGRWQVSTGGGRTPVWARTGRELFYRSADGAVMSVRVEPGPAWRGNPPTQALPVGYFDDSGTTGRTFDIAPDGRRFMMIRRGSDEGAVPPQLVVVQNWFQELKRLVPTN